MTDDQTFSTPEVCQATGATYRQLDYWTRQHVTPVKVDARGSGTKRLYTFEQACAARLAFVLAGLGATAATTRVAVADVLMDPSLWARVAVVHRDGRVDTAWDFERLDGGYIIDLPRERAIVIQALNDLRVAATH